MIKISSSGTSNAGKKNINEDNFYMNGLFIADNNAASGRIYSDSTHSGIHFYGVFDGLGEDVKSGVNPNIDFYEGGTASFAAADMLSRLQRHLKTKENQYSLNNYISSFVRKTNKNICDYIIQKGGYKIGASFAILCFDESSAYAYNIGNSKIYLLRENRLSLISQNDTRAESLAMAKQISADIARYTQDNKILTQYLGINENEKPLDLHVNRLHLRNGDKFLLCTDGLCDLPLDRIYQTLSKDISEQEIVTELVNESMRREGTNNLTLIVSGVSYVDENASKADLLKPTTDMPTHFTPLTFRNKFTFKPQHIKYILYFTGALVLFIIAIVWLFNGPAKKLNNGKETTEAAAKKPTESTTITQPVNNQGNTGNIINTTEREYTFDISTIDINATDAATASSYVDIIEDPIEGTTNAPATAAPTTTVQRPTNPPATNPPAATTHAPVITHTEPPETAAPVTEKPTEITTAEPTTVTEVITEPPTTEAPTEPLTIGEPATEPPTIPETVPETIPETAPEQAPPPTIEEVTIAAE